MQEEKNIDYWKADQNMEWYARQFREPYRITVFFEEFLTSQVGSLAGNKILDCGCGAGSALSYIAKRNSNASFLGIDINPELYTMFEQQKPQNVEYSYGDMFNLDESYKGKFDGIISLQTLSWLPEWKKPIEQMCKLNTKWIAFSSLLYEGKIEYMIRLNNYERPLANGEFSEVFYNIYSVPMIKQFLQEHGFSKFQYMPFEIDMDIPRPDHNDLGYYTLKCDDKRLAFNTCLYQPEGFFFASR